MCNLRQGLKIKRTFADGKFLFLEGGGGRKLEFFTCLFLTFFFLVAFRFLVLYLCAHAC